MTDLTGLLTIANLILLIGGSIGGVIVIRSAIAKAESDVQTRVREALSAENELLQARVMRLEKENKRLGGLIDLIIATLKRTHHIELEVDGELLIMRSPNGTHTTRIPQSGA